MRIVLAQNSNSDTHEWDEYVNHHPESVVSHAIAWRNAIVASYGHQPMYLMAKRGPDICGVLPLFLITSRLFGRVLATCPYASSGAVCADGEEESNGLVEAAMQMADNLGIDYLELKSSRRTAYRELQLNGEYLDYRVSLEEPDIMWRSRLTPAARNKVRRAETFKLTTEKGAHLFDGFYKIIVTNMRELGTPVHSQLFYHNILNSFGSRSNIMAALYEDTPVAAAILLRHRDSVIVYISASLPEFLHMRPNNFLYWEAFRDSYTSQATAFELGRSVAGSGQAKFKESLGAEAKQLYYEYYLVRQKTIPRIQPNNPRYQLARSVWKRLPLNLTKLVGPHLIKNIP